MDITIDREQYKEGCPFWRYGNVCLRKSGPDFVSLCNCHCERMIRYDAEKMIEEKLKHV